MQLHRDLDICFFYVVNGGTIVNLLFLLKYKKRYLEKVRLRIPQNVYKYNIHRKLYLYIFYIILLLSGFYIGVTTGLLSGRNVEGLRREAEVGIGFIRDIPTIGVKVIVLVLILQYTKSQILRVAIICFVCSVVFFLATAHKNGFATGIFLFLCFFHLKYRGFKLYEYVLYYFSIPLGAALLQTIRGGGSLDDFNSHIYVFLNYPVMLFEVNTIPIINKINETGLVWGQEFYATIVKFIPRFLWNEKPVDFGYYYKDLIGYDFEGGGTPIPMIFSFYTNYGYWFIIFYIFWTLLLIKLYLWFCDVNKSYYFRIIILVVIISGTSFMSLVSNMEIMFLFLLMCMCLYQKRYIV
jgi:hypothetical protein